MDTFTHLVASEYQPDGIRDLLRITVMNAFFHCARE